MNKREKSTKKYSVQQGKKETGRSEQASIKKNMKVDVGNDSPQHSYDTRVSGHSTPILKKEYVYDIEDSPEIDYHYSPISLPCTQDGGNEISWDWQTTSSKNSYSNKPQSNLNETPKRTKQLQKKRNSFSPLLQKPLKRKQIKMENIENIGKLTAELKALSERMKDMQQNCNNHVTENKDGGECESENKLLIGFDTEINDDIMIQVVDNHKSNVDTIAINNNIKKSSSYEDLFDDSIDDSMVRCSQEIEEKLNLRKSTENETTVVNIVSDKKEKEFHFLTSINSTGSSRSINTSKNSSSDTSSQLKTYSNNSSKNSASSFSISSLKNTSLQKGSSKNNVIHTANKKLQETKMSDFPDDSFDDCLATFVEDDKLLTKLSEYDFNAPNSDANSSHSKKKGTVPSRNKQSSNSNLSKAVVDTVYNIESNYTDAKLIADDLVGEFEFITDKETVQKSFPGKTSLENRKFFKTKSLSDQCCYQRRNCNLNNKTNKTSNIVVLNPKQYQLNSNCSVSTNSVTTSQNSYKPNTLASINGTENAHALDRLEGNEDGDRIVKYKSTSNLNSIKEVKESLSVQCTPEEIEQKRREAKMRLEAKRKLQQSGRMASATSEVPIKRSVKR
ncbi:uncharacterized protein LOC114877300 isoform X1 [Osmia bicornis bicornis]|uniref:uncharacterized protein LOC114877300 isoform X1 n=1 Tax=Osmia bicornis bicornis TaxID=1437191 RepID=UPI001EAED38B|nr:uncharacterized protein LOC114877300 isoform X1 [Osmia bicornis bicornis]